MTGHISAVLATPFTALCSGSPGTLLHQVSCAGVTWPCEQPPGQTLDTKARRAALVGNTLCVLSHVAAGTVSAGLSTALPWERAAGSLLSPGLAHTLPCAPFPLMTFPRGETVIVPRTPEFCESSQGITDPEGALQKLTEPPISVSLHRSSHIPVPCATNVSFTM